MDDYSIEDYPPPPLLQPATKVALAIIGACLLGCLGLAAVLLSRPAEKATTSAPAAVEPEWNKAALPSKDQAGDPWPECAAVREGRNFGPHPKEDLLIHALFRGRHLVVGQQVRIVVLNQKVRLLEADGGLMQGQASGDNVGDDR
jgi:hypothetical protein